MLHGSCCLDIPSVRNATRSLRSRCPRVETGKNRDRVKEEQMKKICGFLDSQNPIQPYEATAKTCMFDGTGDT